MENPQTLECEPLSLTHNIADFPIGNIPLRQHQQAAVARAGPATSGVSPVTLHPHAWLEAHDLSALAAAPATTLVDEFLTPLAWRGNAPDPRLALAATASFLIRHPWDLLRANEAYVARLEERPRRGEVHPSAVLEGVIHLGAGSRILPGVFIEGNVVIGAKCKIGPNCYIRGNTSIGDACHIGQAVEIKNCLILSHTNVGHLSYVGDSVLGERVNFGAGTMISNLRHDGKNHRSMVGGSLLDTGRRKFGAIIGDGVHTGINTVIYPGRKLWPHTSTRPGEIVQRDLLGGET
jgi:bifunctional UDP-N-acetylglucosamine pyrophosphorylase/glucosamine-1-phosphate N-acetyltransferase